MLLFFIVIRQQTSNKETLCVNDMRIICYVHNNKCNNKKIIYIYVYTLNGSLQKC